MAQQQGQADVRDLCSTGVGWPWREGSASYRRLNDWNRVW